MPLYTTRSAIECADECERRRYFNYFAYGGGIVPIGEYIPFATGTAIHRGTETLFNASGLGNAITNGLDSFTTQLGEKGLLREDETQADYTRQEQASLIEALLRVWALKEYTLLVRRFNILKVEKEHQLPLDKNGDLILLSKPDAVLEDKDSGDLLVYSLKSIKEWYQRQEDSYMVDLQGLTEALAVTVCDKIKVSATKFCFLVKGRPYESKEEKLRDGAIIEVPIWWTASPLIYGYLHTKADGGHTFAHSNKTIKPENLSGFGRLGKDFTKFKVWETKGGVKAWIQLLNTGQVQPELGDVLKAQVITPVEAHRTRAQLQSTYTQIAASEKRIFENFKILKNGGNIDKCFPMRRRSCYFPSSCDYLKICPNGNKDYDPRIAEDPIGSGLFGSREPHYETERITE